VGRAVVDQAFTLGLHDVAPGFPDVYVAGDACHVESTESSDWFQMRLWTQARTMGLYAAQSMANTLDDLNSGFAFEVC